MDKINLLGRTIKAPGIIGSKLLAAPYLTAFIISFFVANVFASGPEYEEKIADGKQFAESQKSKVNDAGKSDSEANNSAPQNSSTTSDSTRDYYNQARANRPVYTFDRQNDPLFKRQFDVSVQGTSLASTYSGCVDLPSGNSSLNTSSTVETCTAEGVMTERDYTCIRTDTPYCSNYSDPDPDVPMPVYTLTEVGVTFPGDWERVDDSTFRKSEHTVTVPWEAEDSFRWICETIVYEYEIQIPDSGVVTDMEITLDSNKGQVSATVNGQSVLSGGNGFSDCRQFFIDRPPRGEWSQPSITPFSGSASIQEHIITGTNIVRVSYYRPSYANVTTTITGVGRESCVEDDWLTLVCPSDVTDKMFELSFMTDKRCIEGDSYVDDQGFTIYRECTKWEEDYRFTQGPNYEEDSACGVLEQRGCGRIGTRCLVMNGDKCDTYELTFQCDESTGGDVALCGDQLICPNGDCGSEYQTVQDNSDDFKKSATWIEMMDQMAEENDGGMTIFSSDSQRCKKRTLGFSDCCQDSGWGTDIGLAQCSTADKQLGLAKEEGRTHYIGRYTRGSFLSRRTYYVYCVYNSKLSRIFMEQANEQLGKDYGTPRSPVCEGLSFAEMENLDMEAIDLSEYYPDAEENAQYSDTPSVLEIQEGVENKVCQLTGDC